MWFKVDRFSTLQPLDGELTPRGPHKKKPPDFAATTTMAPSDVTPDDMPSLRSTPSADTTTAEECAATHTFSEDPTQCEPPSFPSDVPITHEPYAKGVDGDTTSASPTSPISGDLRPKDTPPPSPSPASTSCKPYAVPMKETFALFNALKKKRRHNPDQDLHQLIYLPKPSKGRNSPQTNTFSLFLSPMYLH